ncbi:class I SAM-dependent DNA methyltransferase [Tahibacter amnicola]|uniref:Class I SAM-dependent methyltransferase n=1 Tax=Tahibacter amnicola TaxID=2976241 RepID=A0ABY6BJQ1_9GAMM|nr:class I SAM-dependent methyltransferase [Tahibacter amnicola]UXI69697.1 class I SAM-dependent methyltransferase [Tahibacter amnicola]
MSSAAWSYDAIADVYATDMGQSMPFDDVGWYRQLAIAQGGTTVELGCGTGRILNELLAAGIDAIGVDRSLPMLRRLRLDALSRGLAPSLVQMDLRGLALRGTFSTILLPYSLITYVTDNVTAAAVIGQLREHLAPGGVLVLDAFIPQPVSSFSDFRLDYRRPHGDGALERHKRITANSDGSNRIERRYCLLDASGHPLQEFTTDETIRPYAPAQLVALGQRAGLQVRHVAWNYGQLPDETGARFASVVLAAA